MNYREEQSFMAQCAERLGRHVPGTLPSKSWYLSEPGKGSCYAYSVTWSSPGVLALAGDLGELTITHTSAMPTWWNAVDWLGGAKGGGDWDYHLSKSNARQEYDADETAAAIWADVISEAVRARKAERDSRREYRRDVAQARNEFEMEMAAWEARELLRRTRSHEGEPEDPRPALDDFMPDEGLYGLEPLNIGRTNTARYLGVDLRLGSRDIPEGWEALDTLREELDALMEENDIFTSAGRRELREELEAKCEDGEQAAADLCSKITSDYYGSQSWPHQRLWQMSCLYRWAAIVAGTKEYETETRKAAERAELAAQVRAMSRRMPEPRYWDGFAQLPGVGPMLRYLPREVSHG